jgi:hypothetical protein
VYSRSEKHGGIVVAYTNDPDSLWSNEVWLGAILKKMQVASVGYSNIILFDSREHTPNVSEVGLDYSEAFEQWRIALLFKFPTKSRFCYTVPGSDGNLGNCRVLPPSK